MSTRYPLPKLWVWAALQCTIIVLSLVQITEPFFTYYGVWILFIFIHGAIVGASNINTNHKIDSDFRRRGEPEEVRSFAVSYGGLGNVIGEFFGGGFAIMVQRLVMLWIMPAHPIPPPI